MYSKSNCNESRIIDIYEKRYWEISKASIYKYSCHSAQVIFFKIYFFQSFTIHA